MNSPRMIFKNTMAQTAADLLNRFSNMLITFVMARTLHASGIGVYAAALAYYALMDEATNMGATTYLIRQVANEPDETSRYVVNFSALGSTFAVLGMGIFWAVLPHLDYSPTMRQAIALIVLGILPGTLNAVQYSVFVAHQRVEFVTFTSLISSLITVVGSIYLLVTGQPVITLIILFVAVQYLISVLYFFFINRYVTPLHWRFDLKFALHLLWDIRVFAALSILGGLMAQPEVILLSLLATEDQVGYYSAAIKIAFLWLFISQIFMNNVYPVLSRSFHLADQQFQSIQDKAVKYLLAISLPICVGMVAAARPIIQLFYGDGFETSILPMQLLSLGLPFAYVGAVLWRALTARNQQAVVLKVRIISLFLRLGGGVVLVYYWAEKGAAFSASLNLLITLLFMAFFLQREQVQLKFFQLGWRFALAALAMGALVWLGTGWLQIWLLVPLAVLVYAGLTLAFKAFSTDDLALFRQIRKPT